MKVSLDALDDVVPELAFAPTDLTDAQAQRQVQKRLDQPRCRRGLVGVVWRAVFVVGQLQGLPVAAFGAVFNTASRRTWLALVRSGSLGVTRSLAPFHEIRMCELHLVGRGS